MCTCSHTRGRGGGFLPLPNKEPNSAQKGESEWSRTEMHSCILHETVLMSVILSVYDKTMQIA